MNTIQKKEIDEMRREQEDIVSGLDAEKYAFAKQMEDGLGQKIITGKQNPIMIKPSPCQKIKNFFRKLNYLIMHADEE